MTDRVIEPEDVAVLMPFGSTDEWRDAARTYVERWYRQHFESMPIFGGESPAGEEWSKGAAVDDALQRAGSGAQVLVIADADSFMLDPVELRQAIDLVRYGGHPFVTPHGQVYRLRDEETARIEAVPELKPRLGWTARPPYEGPIGGGITVVHRSAFELVRGIDRRFLGWGGEDLAFGWALQTLAGNGLRLAGRLVHLWHPHPAPNLRGSLASEALVARYKAARGVTRRMAAMVAGEEWGPAEPVEPVQFVMTANRTTVRLPCGDLVRFVGRRFETTDPDTIEQLRTFKIIREERRR